MNYLHTIITTTLTPKYYYCMPLLRRPVLLFYYGKSALSTDHILSIYHDNHAELKAVFDHYSKINDSIIANNTAAAAGAERLLNIFEFGKVLRDAKLMGGDNEVLLVYIYNSCKQYCI